ncbi:Transglutaminase-like enzyme, putative cysteine protease [Filimonas lacunae]|uniref:Transglutaminase-like enzyme, putative cysteine protease n=1 Tax=Filimonas lacunae TaxID=477680 RepID=A0A173MMU1_9BACT|nr:transglutaminase family protein [Filimonas lacunae]BAV08770.1 transglutaminase, N-terminal domain protein [Filimonas lacunae]SIS61464.1 Transglutaminase-like enzyme, putative cysteine protease [Filimonas lacunae]
MPIFNIHHITRYEYDRPVKESTNEIKIYPYQSPDQETLQHDLVITGQPEVQLFQDYWGNKFGSFNVLPVHQKLVIESRLIVRTTAPSQLRINFHGTWQQLEEETAGQLLLLELATPDIVKAQDKIDTITREIQEKTHSAAAAVEYGAEYVFKHFQYIKGITTIETTVDEVLEHKAGVCQDFAHLLLAILRRLHIPCRYVSGYICPNKNGMRGEGATHAWIEAWLPQYGWAGIDPTNNVWVTNNHVKLSVGRHFSDCSPVKGTFKGPARQQLSVFVSVGYEDGHVFEDMNNVNTHQQENDQEVSDGLSVQQ